MREKLKTLLKILVGLGLVVYVLRSRMVDFTTLKEVLFNPRNFVFSMVLLTGMALCCTLRWYILARTQGLSMRFRVIASLTMIGNFFNTLLPGSVGGDLIKAWYVAGEEPDRRTRAVFTVLLDRAIGMAVIVFCAALTLVIARPWVDQHPALKALALTVWIFSGSCVVGAILFFLSNHFRVPGVNKLLNRFKRIEIVHKVLDALTLYRHFPVEILKSILLSTLNVLMMVIVFYVNGRSLGLDLPLSGYFFVVPIGMTVSAIPLLPGGIGVGQVAFYTLFASAGVSNPQQGSTLCTLMQIYIILFNCSGAIFYLKFKRQSPRRSKRSTVLEGPTLATDGI